MNCAVDVCTLIQCCLHCGQSVEIDKLHMYDTFSHKKRTHTHTALLKQHKSGVQQCGP